MSKLHKPKAAKTIVMKALIIYRDFISAAKANSALQLSAHLTDIEVEWNVRPWRLDMLKFPPTADEALIDAADAHLILFAGDCAQSMPFWLQDWLELWAKHKQVTAAALAVMSAGCSKILTSSATLDLTQFAKVHGLEIIFDDRDVIPTTSLAQNEFLGRANPDLSKAVRASMNI
ncbi:MAG: hypothetical protein WDN00_05195 [Limisphaerales bacterium]